MLSPKGIEVLLRVCRFGVCHYDLHIAEVYLIRVKKVR